MIAGAPLRSGHEGCDVQINAVRGEEEDCVVSMRSFKAAQGWSFLGLKTWTCQRIGSHGLRLDCIGCP